MSIFPDHLIRGAVEHFLHPWIDLHYQAFGIKQNNRVGQGTKNIRKTDETIFPATRLPVRALFFRQVGHIVPFHFLSANRTNRGKPESACAGFCSPGMHILIRVAKILPAFSRKAGPGNDCSALRRARNFFCYGEKFMAGWGQTKKKLKGKITNHSP
jgi:hypothetical protein